MDARPICERLAPPTPAEVRRARKLANLSQADAARLVSTAQGQPYRTWQGYEVEAGQRGHRAIPLATWELFLLLTDQHPQHQLVRRPAGLAATPGVSA